MKRSGLKRALASAVLAAAGPAYSANSVWIATAEAAYDDYYFGLGAIIPLPRYDLGHGWVQRYWLDNYTYSYESGPRRIEAAVWGAEAMLGYQASKPGLYGATYLGVRYGNTELSPEDPGNGARGTQLRLKGQLEGTVAFSKRWGGEGIVAYTFGLNGYWTRARLLRSLAGTTFIGPELIVQGDPTYKARKVGVVYGGLQPFAGAFLNLRGGYRIQSGANSPYVGVELVGQF